MTLAASYSRTRMRLLIRALAVAVALCLMPRPMLGWGNEGHMAINRVAAAKMPAAMPAFLAGAVDRLEYLGPEPDRWRQRDEYALNRAQAPDHYIDLECVEGIELPPDRYAFYKLLYERRAAIAHGNPVPARLAALGLKADDLLPERVGTQPYIVAEIFERLRGAFREYRRLKREHQPTAPVEENIVFYAGWLGHYVADAANPLHTTVKGAGWIGPNPNGYTTDHNIHWRMETEFVHHNLSQLGFADRVKAPVVLQDPWQDYLNYLWSSHALVEQVYQLNKAGGFKGEGTAESREFIRGRLAAGAQMLLNLWYTAWVQSGEPVSSL